MRARVVIDVDRIEDRETRRDIVKYSRVLCPPHHQLFAIWRSALEDDHIVLQGSDGRQLLATVYQKGITNIHGQHVCFLNFRPIGPIEATSEGAESVRSDLRNDFAANHFRACTFSWLGTEVRAVSTHDEDAAFHRLIQTHKMGGCRSYVSFVALRSGRVCGAAALDVDQDIGFDGAAFGRFGSDLSFLRKYFFLIRRMVACRSVSSWRVYRSIVHSLETMTEALSEEPILILGGHTHEPQPAATKEGYLVEIPKHARQALFYWKPIRGFILDPPPTEAVRAKRNELKQYASSKRNF